MNPDNENYHDGEWDDRWDVAWNESDWNRFLQRHDHEVTRFTDHYNSLKLSPQRLDEAARRMGWERDDWGGGESGDESDDEPYNGEPDQRPEPEHSDSDPYTLHKHPVYVVTRALYGELRKHWEQFMNAASVQAGPRLVWRFAQAIGDGENHAILGVQALDMGDYALTVCELKRALEAVNAAFSLLGELPQDESVSRALFVREAQFRLFDLREVWLRVIYDCREEVRRRFGNE